ncbi:hypothetical protein MPER_04286, partial [Moniliophthora perniciosa FA553]
MLCSAFRAIRKCVQQALEARRLRRFEIGLHQFNAISGLAAASSTAGKALEAVKAKVEELAARTRFERKDHEKMRDSTARRFAASMTESLKAKYKMKKEKEEREYAEALEREMKERANLERIKAEILKARMGTFVPQSADFPRDDELKNNLRFAQATQRQIQDQVDNYLQVAELLQQAWRKLYRCSEALHMALENSGDGKLTIAE